MRLVFEWDANKARANIRKHKVAFEEGKTVFNDPFLITFADEYHSESEERCISIGTSARHRILLVVHTERAEAEDVALIRLISCRKATASERRTYEEGQ
ncbi:MAG: BrnT family toxin [Planctomycetes bacterium]|nr:BrnT family toxin [Planctomycetota bacterium]